MKSLDQVRSETWFPCKMGTVLGTQFRLDEREWKRLMQAFADGGWALMPKELTPEQVEPFAIWCARGNNGGTWAEHYTEEQKEFWRRFVREFLGAVLQQPVG